MKKETSADLLLQEAFNENAEPTGHELIRLQRFIKLLSTNNKHILQTDSGIALTGCADLTGH